jgi:predicted nucleic acid-binding protein
VKIVVDASVALSWIFERTNLTEKKISNAVLKAMVNTETIVPSLWHTEISNALLVGERRKIITEAQMIDYLSKIDELPIRTDDIILSQRRDMMISLAREHGLTAYDSVYLDLALVNNAMLATFDKKLAEAILQAGGKLFE